MPATFWQMASNFWMLFEILNKETRDKHNFVVSTVPVPGLALVSQQQAQCWLNLGHVYSAFILYLVILDAIYQYYISMLAYFICYLTILYSFPCVFLMLFSNIISLCFAYFRCCLAILYSYACVFSMLFSNIFSMFQVSTLHMDINGLVKNCRVFFYPPTIFVS